MNVSLHCLSERQMMLAVNGFERVFIGTIVPILIVFGISGNILNLTVLLAPTLRTRSNLLLASLAVADIVFLVFMLPHSLAHYKIFAFSYWFRRLYLGNKMHLLAILNWASAAAIWLIFVICIERLIGIKYPLSVRKHKKILTPAVMVGFVVITTGVLTSYNHFSYFCATKIFCNGSQFHAMCIRMDSEWWFRNQTNPNSALVKGIAHWGPHLNAIFVVVLPILMVLVSNAMLIYTLRQRSNLFDAKTDTTDAVLVVDGNEIYVQKAKLAALSPYFNALFFAGFGEAGSDRIDIHYDFDVMLACVEVVNGLIPSMTDSLDGIEKLLVAADFFDLAVVKMICEFALASRFLQENPISLLVMAGQYGLHELKARILPKIKYSEIHSWCKADTRPVRDDISSVSAQELLMLVNELPLDDSPYGSPVKPSKSLPRDINKDGNVLSIFDKKTASSNVVLIVQEKEIHVEKSKLDANSTYFAKLISSSPRQKSGSKRVELDDVYTVVLACVQIIHGHIPPMTYDLSGLDKLLKAAERFSIPMVKMVCGMGLRLISDEPVDAFLLAGKHGLKDVQTMMMPLITREALLDWKTKHIPVASSHLSGSRARHSNARCLRQYLYDVRGSPPPVVNRAELPAKQKPVHPLDSSNALSACCLRIFLAKLF